LHQGCADRLTNDGGRVENGKGHRRPCPHQCRQRERPRASTLSAFATKCSRKALVILDGSRRALGNRGRAVNGPRAVVGITATTKMPERSRKTSRRGLSLGRYTSDRVHFRFFTRILSVRTLNGWRRDRFLVSAFCDRRGDGRLPASPAQALHWCLWLP
jgi:hypothetical protein